MPRLDDSRDALILALETHYGSSAASKSGPVGADRGLALFERLTRVALGRVASTKMATSAFEALRDGGMLEPDILASANPLEIDDVLKEARVAMAIKSLRPLQKLARWFGDRGPTLDAEEIAKLSTEAIRDEWRAINGIGLAGADALLLFGLGRVSYPVDRATFRILVRHGWLDPTADYDEARSVVERLGQSVIRAGEARNGDEPVDATAAAVLVNLSDWFERLGRDFCKPSQARCERCPLHPFLPPDGPVEVE